MKKYRIFSALSAIALLMAGGCSDDTLKTVANGGGSDVEKGPGVYMTINFELPSAKETRSFTNGDNSSSSGTEVAKDYENKVSSVAVVLARVTDNGFIAASSMDEDNDIMEAVGSSGRSYKVTSTFLKSDLAALYNDATYDQIDNNGNYKINVFVFCNPTKELREGRLANGDVNGFTGLEKLTYGDTDWIDWCGTYSESKEENGLNDNSIWKSGGFLMSNSSIAERLLPPSLNDWDGFTTVASAFNLSGMNNFGRPNQIDNYNNGNGKVNVERAAARYDFRDGALDGAYVDGSTQTDKTYNGCGPQTYRVVLDSKEMPLLDVYLGKMSLVNMNNLYYFIRRVSNDGLPYTSVDGETNGFEICGFEKPWFTSLTQAGDPKDGNYVVDAWAKWKLDTPSEGFEDHFVYPFFVGKDGDMSNLVVEDDRWYTSVVSNVLAGDVMDNPQTWNPSEDGIKYAPYHVWRYLTEGTIPATQKNQQYGISNGVVFKGMIKPVREANDATDDVYTKMLLNATKIVADPADTGNPILFAFANHVYCSWENIKRQAIQFALTDSKFENGKWQLTFDRTAALYHAVFGNGGFGTIKFKNNNGEPDFLVTNDDPDATQTYTDELKEDDGTLPDPASDEPGATLHACSNYLYNEWAASGYENETKFNAFREWAVVYNHITFYEKSYDKDLGGWAYYCYYYYWNRHNDNGLPGIMAPMEFDVVRNNVYKLAVTKIARLGHPRNPDNDPDKPTPNTPDESDDLYITVTCAALPWVVRVNDIEF